MNIMKNTTRTLCTIALLSGSLNAIASNDVQKFGYVNPERVYTETKAAKRIETTLQKEFGEQQQKLVALQKSGIKLQEQLSSNKLGGSQRKHAEEQLRENVQQYRIAAAHLAEEYNLRRNEEFAALQNNANNVIKNIAEKEKYDLIVQEAVFVVRKYDITDRVIKALDEAEPR
ncbi:OmpH family outer membrane protein [Kingella negevensis]|uniref:OmpH family outer membrane protein n=1 Tax=Kingella negevensis TaxID=1522312 RepID=UPI00050A18EA